MSAVAAKWPSARLGDVVQFERESVLPREAGPRRYVGLEHISSDGALANSETASETLESSKFVFGPDHILYGKLRPYLRKVARPHFKGICSTDILPVRPTKHVDRDFLYHSLRADAFVQLATARSAGVNLPRISPAQLSEFSILLPPVQEQKRIAAILDKADAIRAMRRAALTLADDLLRATFLDMFGEGSPSDERWPTSKLGNLLEFLTSGSRGWAQYYRDEGAKFIRIENVKRGYLDLSDVQYIDPPRNAEAKRTRVVAGDVLLSITADLGRVAVVPPTVGEAYVSQHLAILRPADVHPAYLCAYLSMPDGQRQFMRMNRDAVKAGLNFDDIRSVKVPVPPRSLQTRYAEREQAIRSSKAQQISDLADADGLYASLAQRAFRGKL